MQTMYTAPPSNDFPEVDRDKGLPEAIPRPELLDQGQWSAKEVASNLYTESFEPVSMEKQDRWTRWPVLLLYGLIVALNAGLIGGFIGKAINNHINDTSLGDGCSSTTSTTANNTEVRTLSIPETDCPSDIHKQILLNRVSTFLKVSYKTLCGRRWTKEYLIAISSPTPSDCIEACASYTTRGNMTCLGASFVPGWWNQTRAMEGDKKKPFNCFLMGGEDTLIAPNEKDYEIVALCLKESACPGD